MENISGTKCSHKHTLTEGIESLENDEPKFGPDWEYFEDKFDIRDTSERFERCSRGSMFIEEETAGHSPKFGADWEQFNGDIKKADARQTENTAKKEINETETVFDSPNVEINEWERLKKVLAKTEIQKEEHSTNDQTKAEEESISKRTNSFEDFSTLRLRAVSLQGIYPINSTKEKYVCEISDICEMPDEVLVMTDTRNKRLRKLGINYVLTGCLKLPDCPFGVCKVDKTKVAITMFTLKKVQFVSVKKKMALRKSFNVRDCCQGIAYSEGLFYICCGGSSSLDTDGIESPGHLEVYSQSGTYLATYSNGISSPRYLCINNDTTRIFVTDHYNGIVVLDMDGRLVSQISHNECTYPSGICGLNKELLCVAYHERNEILSFDKTGHFKQVLLQRKEGLMAPKAICYDIDRFRLIVSTMWGDDTIKVFHLHLTKNKYEISAETF